MDFLHFFKSFFKKNSQTFENLKIELKITKIKLKI